ncbi:signal peptidase I [Candidatus Uhrbacteria bacterium]|nr:signal peptidase I [Candidatus Uhrbacteria bacterium]
MWLILIRQYISKALFIVLNIILFVFFIRFFIADFGVISGPSMEPTFNDAEFFIVSKWPLFFRPLERFELVQVINVKQPDSLLVKRVIGLPGETVYFTQNKVCIKNRENPSGKCLEEPYLAPQSITRPSAENYAETFVPPGYYYLMGDNRAISADSREYGPVPRKYILGSAVKL